MGRRMITNLTSTSAMMSPDQIAQYKKDAETTHYKSDFNFLNTHNGWRIGKIHLIVAPTHAGKSTLTRSMIWDFVINNPDSVVYLWLSEESKEDFLQELSKVGLQQEQLYRIHVFSEQDRDMSISERKLFFAETLNTISPSIVFFDNVTTSEFYMDRKIEEQSSFAKYLKRKANEELIPIVVIAHTGGDSGLMNRLLELNMIRGGKSIVNLTEFAYILQRFKVTNPNTGKDEYFPTIRLEKHRGFVCEDTMFKLRFNNRTVTFMEDRAINWEEFKDAFKKQLTL